MNDGVLVEALRARDPGALAALYDTHAGGLYRYCRTLLAGPDAAQVALRDTLIAAEALIGSLADPGMLRPWLYALARGECMRRRTPGEEGGPEPGQAPVPTAPFPRAGGDEAETDLRLAAGSAVAALPAEDREVLELVARHDMDTGDVAAVLGTGERHARALLDAATERLREAVTVEIIARRPSHDCERAAAILRGFSGELTPQERGQLTRHLARCETCAGHRVRQVSPAKVFSLLPRVALPETLRVRVLSSFIDPELVPYRRYVAKRVGGLTVAGFPRAGARREGRLAQAVAGAVAAVAAVATIALVFAQFSGDLREGAGDSIVRHRPPAAEAPAATGSGPADTASPGTSDDDAADSSSEPPASGDTAEPGGSVRAADPVVLPRPAPLPAPVTPATARPPRHHEPTRSPAAPPTTKPTTPPTTKPTIKPTTRPSGSASPPSDETPTPPDDDPGSGGPGGSDDPGDGPDVPPEGPPTGGPPRGGPPPAHWPGRRPPHREHQHHHGGRPHYPYPHAPRDCPPSPSGSTYLPAPQKGRPTT
ncbi:RNA polymerase sigma factor [Microbispora amethystogenes]|uniref:RNA polymerase sigma-70 region 2 domain-containing protein n=1 Tax=Microbispora amethystogenes TaxID=1427754 RepID=A0ABQ4FP16_9ACTN|nr:RNA polymerase sigma factor [Microbispora amethystogenes]GIH36560.1 hypothetical protein Mam01_67240 [Microbispora amethystogenes]